MSPALLMLVIDAARRNPLGALVGIGLVYLLAKIVSYLRFRRHRRRNGSRLGEWSDAYFREYIGADPAPPPRPEAPLPRWRVKP